MMARKVGAAAAVLLLLTGCAPQWVRNSPADTIRWRFGQLGGLDGLALTVASDPQVEASPFGPALAFDGIDDALFINSHPLAGAKRFTIEAIFRPDGGAFEQRWLHLAEAAAAPSSGAFPPVDARGPRILFEIRVKGDRWYLDAFAAGDGYSQALIFPDKMHPVGRWYHVAQVYDGRVYRSYVDGQLQGEAPMAYRPQGNGFSSIGTRINRRDYFLGAILSARFTRETLSPSQFAMPRRRHRSSAPTDDRLQDRKDGR